MNKTPILSDILPRLEALNDQQWFFRLLEHEFMDRLNDSGPKIAQAYTTDIYARNPYSSRIHIKLSELPEFQAAHRALTFGAYFSTSYEIATKFFSSAIELLRVMMPGCIEEWNDFVGAPEGQYARLLADSTVATSTPVTACTLETISYCRYRRNAFIHDNIAPPPAFSSLVSTHGTALNARWASEREDLDFRVPLTGTPNDKDIIVLFQLLRICLQELDVHLASLISPEAIARYIAVNRYGKQRTRMNIEIARSRASDIRKQAQLQFGLDPGDSVAMQAAQNVGRI